MLLPVAFLLYLANDSPKSYRLPRPFLNPYVWNRICHAWAKSFQTLLQALTEFLEYPVLHAARQTMRSIYQSLGSSVWSVHFFPFSFLLCISIGCQSWLFGLSASRVLVLDNVCAVRYMVKLIRLWSSWSWFRGRRYLEASLPFCNSCSKPLRELCEVFENTILISHIFLEIFFVAINQTYSYHQ